MSPIILNDEWNANVVQVIGHIGRKIPLIHHNSDLRTNIINPNALLRDVNTHIVYLLKHTHICTHTHQATGLVCK